MKTRLCVLAGLAISFAIPAFAQRKEAIDPQTLAQFDAHRTKYSEAYNNNDAAALAALYAEDALFITDRGPVYGRHAIEKWYADTFRQWPITNFSRDTYGLNVIDTVAWSVEEWWGILHGESGPVLVEGYESAIYFREGDAWKIRMLTVTEKPRPRQNRGDEARNQ
jgi:uncharacterized protein (TIGR02246 family)